MTSVPEAITKEVRRRRQPVVTWFEIEQIIRRLYRERVFDGERLALRGSVPSPRTLAAIRASLGARQGFTEKRTETIPRDLLRQVIEERAAVAQHFPLAEDPDFPSSVARVAGVPDAPADEVCCLVDPWCYVSHLSAMQQWGLTNRNPAALHLTRPAKKLWRELAKAEIRKEYGDLLPGQTAPRPRERVTFPQTVRHRALHVFEPNFAGQAIMVPDSHARVATVGQTFRDMVHEPSLCGGMSHVLDVWEEHAPTYVDEIIETMNRPDLKATKIALMRAGYILAERLGIQDHRLDEWAALAEQGGSRKLDPERPFHSSYSERWMISLNA